MISYVIVNKPEVRNDIVSIIAYYNCISPELSKQFIFRLKEAREAISRSPRGFQIKYKK